MPTYIKKPNNPERYATALRYEKANRLLNWDCANGLYALIVQTPFDTNATEYLDLLLDKLSRLELPVGQFTQVLENVFVRFVTPAEKGRDRGCPIHSEASTYTVLGCFPAEGDICEVYEPEASTMVSPFCQIPLDVNVTVCQDMTLTGVFRKREVPTGFYRIEIRFPDSFTDSYRSGELYYTVGGMDIPITRKMIAQHTFFVYTTDKPEISSCNKGLRLITANG